jgi:stage IV sporulation protein FB
MVRFTLFGIPVEIQPWFWLGTAFFGGLTYIGSPDDLKAVLMFMFAATVSILVHEFGHALTGQRLAGGQPNIVLHGFGGLAYNRGARFTPRQDFWMTAMGPGAGFILFGIIALILVIAFGREDGLSLIGNSLFKLGRPVGDPAWSFFQDHVPLRRLVHAFLVVNFWWGIINLAPVLPLDGGHIVATFVRPKSKVYTIAIVSGIAIALISLLLTKRYYTAMMFGYFAYTNYQSLQNLHGR